ncbi:MAG: DsbA family protein [Rickettsiales bacterium]|nr:DsbA family protein [Rickettsiales bacterium]
MSSEDKILSLPIIFVLVILVVIAGFNFYTSQNPSVLNEEDVAAVVEKYLEENKDKTVATGSNEETANFLENNSDKIIEQMSGTMSEELINQKIAEYIRKNPQVIIESLNAWQREQQEAQRRKAIDTIKEKTSELHNNPTSPFVGNPDGDIVVVEFFDYNCGFCKRVLPSIDQLLQEDSNVKIVFKEYPILSENSRLIARYGLAVNQIDPSKYFDFHSAMMTASGSQSESSLLKLVETLGIDPEKAKQEANGVEVNRQLIATNELGRSIGVSGTPAFIIGNRLVPGAVQYDQLKNIIAEERAKMAEDAKE